MMMMMIYSYDDTFYLYNFIRYSKIVFCFFIYDGNGIFDVNHYRKKQTLSAGCLVALKFKIEEFCKILFCVFLLQ